MIPPDQIAELQLLAARAEASVDGSLGTARYSSVRRVRFGDSPAFSMFAVSVADDRKSQDIMLCRTPEVAKFIVALLSFGAAIVAEHQPADPEA